MIITLCVATLALSQLFKFQYAHWKPENRHAFAWTRITTLRTIIVWHCSKNRCTEWTNSKNVLSSNLKNICLIRYEQWSSCHTWIRTTRLLMTEQSTIRARNVCWYTSRQEGVLNDVVGYISSILKVTGKRVPRDVDSALMLWWCWWSNTHSWYLWR